MPRNRSLLMTPLIALLIGLTPIAPAWGIVVLRKGAPKPLMGYLTREDAGSVSLREPLPSGGFREHTIPRAEIEELVVTVDPLRLAALDPVRPATYREYAEELAEKQRDPEAREMAVRLFHIAAWLEEGPSRQSALLGLIALARDDAERRRWRAAAYLTDPSHDRELLAGAGDVPAAATMATRPSLEGVLAGIRALRRGMFGEAKGIFERPAAREGLETIARHLSREELLLLCTARPLSDDQLRKLLLAEIDLERSLADEPATNIESAAARPAPWSQAVRGGGMAPLPTLDLLHLTEFDPRASVYRGGTWVKP
ncbi:MAG: hypothetical protein SFU86_23530 [Pirellulaceae bacterium]|nr:hypothetical protein [Pirellulaceae bacterium]